MLTDRLAFEDRSYILSTSETAGGRGINAAKVIHSFGGKTVAIVTADGKCCSRFEELIEQTGLPVDIVRIRQQIRTNLTISDKHGLTVKLNEIGPEVSEAEAEVVLKTVEKRLAKASWLMICGSLPPGVELHYYSKLIAMAAKAGVKTLLDSDGEALQNGLEAHPTVVMPNQQEAERLLNRALITRPHFFDAAERIHSIGAEAVVLSLGARGAVARSASGLFEVIPPESGRCVPDRLGRCTLRRLHVGLG